MRRVRYTGSIGLHDYLLNAIGLGVWGPGIRKVRKSGESEGPVSPKIRVLWFGESGNLKIRGIKGGGTW